jgi:Ca2+-dependent lipid-binding protein
MPVLIGADAIEAGERLRLRVCDSDRFSSDDAIGVVEVDISTLVEKEQETHDKNLQRRSDSLTADQPGMRVSGKLHWSVQFYPLWQMGPEELQSKIKNIAAARQKRGEPPSGEAVPWWMEMVNKYFGEDIPDWVAERAERRKETLEWFTGEKERDELEAAAKPSEDLRSGVVQVSQLEY